ncbi:YggU family protein [Candidatus Woesearchaeota archaeon]|nr:MAG: YggU family protein [Candidatus Woesearchaeota archaeon]
MVSSNSQIKIIVRTNASKTQLLSYDETKSAFRLDVAAPPDKNRANREIIKFFSKKFKKKAKIISGLKSKIKIVELI